MTPRHASELPVLLALVFRSIVDELHGELARVGHPEIRPAHAFAFQAIGAEGSTAAAIAERLGVTKQAVAKMLDYLEARGYVTREQAREDRREKIVRLTSRSHDVLSRSAAIFERLSAGWERSVGPERLSALGDDLDRLARRPDGSLPPLRPVW